MIEMFFWGAGVVSKSNENVFDKEEEDNVHYHLLLHSFKDVKNNWIDAKTKNVCMMDRSSRNVK